MNLEDTIINKKIALHQRLHRNSGFLLVASDQNDHFIKNDSFAGVSGND